MDTKTSTGVVNLAFDLGLTSETEHSSVHDTTSLHSKNENAKEEDTRSNFSQRSTSSSLSSEGALKQRDINSTPSNASTKNEQPRQTFSSLQSPLRTSLCLTGDQPSSVVNKNVQPPARMQLENDVTSSVPNGSVNTASEFGTLSKAYYRDVRLSLDLSKPSEDQPHGESCYVKCIEDDSMTVSSGSNSSCDGCNERVTQYYKIIVKYIVERPLFCFSIWAMLYIFWGDSALPGGSLFALAVLEITALSLGYIAEVFQLPGLVGMLAAGLILRNVPHIDVAKDLDSSVSSPFRGVSIVILLVRGGLGFNAANIVKFKNIIPSLVIGSCVLEAVGATVAVYLITDFPFEWASLMGCIMSAMSGVAVLPYLATTEKWLSLKADPCICTPNHQRVISIARTGCGLDAILSICLAEVALGFIFAEGDTGKGLLKGAVEVVMGGVFGIIWGFLVGGLLDDTSSNEKRVVAVFAGGVMSLLGFTKVGYPRGGPLAVFAGTVIVASLWRNKGIGGTNNERLSGSFTLIWFILQPLLFAIIGARIDFDVVDWTFVTKGLICIVIGMMVRFLVSFLMTNWGNLTLRERAYISLAWLPKGTVQAALGPVALDTALSSDNLSPDIDYEDFGNKVMNLSATSVIAAATLGCLLLRFVGPRLLVQK